MTGETQVAGNPEGSWKRVSSPKPYIIEFLLISGAGSWIALLIQNEFSAWVVITAAILLAAGLVSLNWKVVYTRGNDFLITTLFYSEVVMANDVCMVVNRPGPLWHRFRIHLCRPARFGWNLSFVPVAFYSDKADLTPISPAPAGSNVNISQ